MWPTFKFWQYDIKVRQQHSGCSTVTRVDIKGGSRSWRESSHLILEDLHFPFDLVLVFVNEFVIFSFYIIFVIVNENHTGHLLTRSDLTAEIGFCCQPRYNWRGLWERDDRCFLTISSHELTSCYFLFLIIYFYRLISFQCYDVRLHKLYCMLCNHRYAQFLEPSLLIGLLVTLRDSITQY